MPRITGYRERHYGNFYDALPILKLDGSARLFGNANIGAPHLTNMLRGQQLEGDMTFVLFNVYVRTNLGRARPLLSEAKRKEVRDLFVDDNAGDAIGTLMRECQWERGPLMKALEEWAHTAVVEVIVGDRPMFTMNAHDLMDGPAVGPGRVDEHERLAWRKQIARPIIIPVRQNISVKVTSPDDSPAMALRRLAADAGVLPEPLVWVHLEGISSRDAC